PAGQEVADALQPEPRPAVTGARAKQHRHLLPVLLAEIAWIQVEAPAIEAFGRLHSVSLRSIAGWSAGPGRAAPPCAPFPGAPPRGRRASAGSTAAARRPRPPPRPR